MTLSDRGAPKPAGSPYLPRILVVDDTRVFRDSLCQLLEESGQVRIIGTANDGNDAVEKAHLLRPDLVLMDLQMPVMHGIEAMRLMKQQPSPPKVVIMSFDEGGATAEGVVRAGADAFYPKRTVLTDLLELLPALFPGRTRGNDSADRP
jgi:DNA-binding NarL/FixJ family response regulator